MSTLATVLADLRTQLNSQLSLASSVELDSDYSTRQATAASGSTGYQIRSQYQQAHDTGNVTYQGGAIELEIRHKLADGFAERAYTESAMQTQQALLLGGAFWRALDGLHQVDTGPEIETDVTRTGRVISWSVLVTFLITP